MRAQHLAVDVDDLAGFGGAGLEPLNHVGVMAARHEADVLAVMLVGDCQSELACQFTRLRLGALAEREAQQVKLLARGAKQEIALVSLFLARAKERAPAIGQAARGDVMAGCQHLGAELARGNQEIVELDRHIAVDARDRRLAVDITFGETVDHRLLEAALVVEHVMGNGERIGNAAGVVDVLTGAAGALAVGRGAVVVELQRDADDVIALGLEQRGRHRGIDATGHGDDDTGVLRAAFEVEGIWHGFASYYRWRPKARNVRPRAQKSAARSG